MAQIDHVVYPRKKERNDVLSVRITAKKLKGIKQAKLASVLGVTQGRISQLVNEEPNHYAALRKYIQDAGRRDSVLLLLQKERVD
jgi:predicted XRE-type DNA-binding protein